MLEALQWSDTGMFETDLRRVVITSTDKVKNLILGGGGCGRKQSLVVEVVTERRCQGLRLASVSAGNIKSL